MALIHRNDTFDDSDILPWWQLFTGNLNVAVSIGEGSPVAGAIATSYGVDPSGIDWGFAKLQSLFTMAHTDDLIARGTVDLTGGDAASWGHSIQVGLRDPSNSNEHLVAMVRTAGGGVGLYRFSGPSAGRNTPGNWLYWGGTSNQQGVLDVFYDQSESNLKFSWRDPGLTWYVIDNETYTFGAAARAVVYFDMWWDDYSRNDYPILSTLGLMHMQAASYSDIDAPEYSSSSIGIDGNLLTITLNEDIAGTPSGFTLTADGSSVSLSAGAINGSAITFTTDRIYKGQAVLLSYSGTDIEDLAGNKLGSLVDSSVTNNSGKSLSGYAARNSRWATIGYRRR